jgi:hypothetical protein
VKLIFIHHSTGEGWLADDYGGLGIALRNNNYFVSDTNYGWTGGGTNIGDRTDIGNWYEWFAGPNRDAIMASLFAESEQHSSYSRRATDPGGPNQIILFKSCFPNSDLRGNPDDPPTPGDNPLRNQGCCSDDHNVANAKGIYNDILAYFRTRQDKLFVLIVTPPLVESGTSAEHAANARALSNWLVNDWLAGYPYQNVAVFDYYNVLTSNGGNPEANDLGSPTGNHHRWRAGAVEHVQSVYNNYAAYGQDDDSHPTSAGQCKATGEFVPLLNVFCHRWQASQYLFGAPALWRNAYGLRQGWMGQNLYPRTVADVDGDSQGDVVAFGRWGTSVSLSTGTGFGAPARWIAQFGVAQGWATQHLFPRDVADVNGDGKADVVGFGAWGAMVSLSNGSGFDSPSRWSAQFGLARGWRNQDLYPRLLADVDGDGDADIVGFGAAGTFVSLSDGTRFLTPTLGIKGFGVAQGWTSQNLFPRAVADVNGDGKADVVGFSPTGVRVALSNGAGFDAPALWIANYGTGAGGWSSQNTCPRVLADVNGDGQADIIGFAWPGTFVSLSTGTGFAAPVLGIPAFGGRPAAGGWTSQNLFPRTAADVNLDGKADIVGFGLYGVVVSLAQ